MLTPDEIKVIAGAVSSCRAKPAVFRIRASFSPNICQEFTCAAETWAEQRVEVDAAEKRLSAEITEKLENNQLQLPTFNEFCEKGFSLSLRQTGKAEMTIPLETFPQFYEVVTCEPERPDDKNDFTSPPKELIGPAAERVVEKFHASVAAGEITEEQYNSRLQLKIRQCAAWQRAKAFWLAGITWYQKMCAAALAKDEAAEVLLDLPDLLAVYDEHVSAGDKSDLLADATAPVDFAGKKSFTVSAKITAVETLVQHDAIYFNQPPDLLSWFKYAQIITQNPAYPVYQLFSEGSEYIEICDYQTRCGCLDEYT